MNLLISLLDWWNLIFELPFVGAVLYILLLATGTVATGEGDTDTDVGSGPDVDHDYDHSIEHTVGVGHDHAESSTFFNVLSFLGVGKVPLSILLVSLWVLWGFIGWTSNQVLAGIMPPAIFIWLSIFIAAVGSVFLTRYLAIGLSRLLPSTETYGVRKGELEGMEGEAYHRITPTTGTAQMRDGYGNLLLVECRTQQGEKVINAGSKIRLLSYDSEQEVYIVITEDQLMSHNP